MAGSALSLSSAKRLDNITPDESQLIWDSIYAGFSVRKTADKLGYTFRALEDWLYQPARVDQLNRARSSLASQLASQTITIADGPWGDGETCRPRADASQAETFPDAARDKLRIQARQWLASKWDKETYSAAPTVQVNVDARSLHIDSLRKSSSDLQATGRLLAGSSSNALQQKALDPPTSTFGGPPWRGGTSSLDKTAERNTGGQEAPINKEGSASAEEEFAGEGLG